MAQQTKTVTKQPASKTRRVAVEADHIQQVRVAHADTKEEHVLGVDWSKLDANTIHVMAARAIKTAVYNAYTSTEGDHAKKQKAAEAKIEAIESNNPGGRATSFTARETLLIGLYKAVFNGGKPIKGGDAEAWRQIIKLDQNKRDMLENMALVTTGATVTLENE